VTDCSSSGTVKGTDYYVGGLVGQNSSEGPVTRCYSTGTVKGTEYIGGLVGSNEGVVMECYSAGSVSGDCDVGGLVGENLQGEVMQCYSAGSVSGKTGVGGLVGSCTDYGGGFWWPDMEPVDPAKVVKNCFWDTQTSGQATSDGGTGKSTAEMQTASTFLDAGWDFAGETANGTSEIWQMPQGGGYPLLAVLNGYSPPRLQGAGTAEDPYLIHDALELGAVVHHSRSGHYRLVVPIDLSGIRWSTAVIPRFAGTFDGNGYQIAHLTIQGGNYLGLFGQLDAGAKVNDLGVVDVNITGSGYDVGGLVGQNAAEVTHCYSSGSVSGGACVGGLVGCHYGRLSTATVTRCYSTGPVTGSDSVGGLVGYNFQGYNFQGLTTASFWDTQTSGQAKSDGGTGKTTAEMQTASTFLQAGWDFIGETANGTEDIWWINEGKDYPRLWWEARN
jgi:hypothetical protein